MKMDTLTSETMKELLGQQGYPCVSIYMPTRPDAPFGAEHRTRFKTLKRQARELAAAATHNDEAVLDELFAPARELLANEDFWRQQGLGLAHFATPHGAKTWRLPMEFEELALCGPRFHIKPLLPIFSDDGHFHILALSMNKVRLFRCTRHAGQEIPLPDAPQSLEQSMRHDDPEKQLQFHTGDSSPQGKRPAVHHGQGAGHDEKDIRIEEYLRKVDAAVHKTLDGDRAPVIAACVENVFGLLWRVSRLKNLAESPLRGNPDEMSEEELRTSAWELVAPEVRKARENARQQFHDRLGTGLASSMLEEVAPAAAHGRVASLFVPLGIRLWGEFNQSEGSVSLHETPRPESQDLLDMAAAQTFKQGGQVYALKPEDVPGKGSIAAVFRY